MQHVFIDVEAYGPPGIGRPFALGAVKFDRERKVYARFQAKIGWDGVSIAADQGTMEWLSKQEPRVLEQLRGGEPFPKVWGDFVDWLGDGLEDWFARVARLAKEGVLPLAFYADDWSDFAWLDIEARRHSLPALRQYGAQYDTSAFVKAADPLRHHNEAARYGELVPHIADHDAIRAALDFIAALATAPVHWRKNLGFV